MSSSPTSACRPLTACARCPDAWVGRHVLDHLHPADSPALMDLFQRLLAQPGAVVSAEARFLQQDNAWRWVEATATNALDDPSVGAIIVNFRDIGERKQH